MSNLYRGPIDASCQVSVHLARCFRREDLKKSANQKQELSFCHHFAPVVYRPLTFYILIFSSETPQPNELKLGMKHL
jgi:hypothetical protein